MGMIKRAGQDTDDRSHKNVQMYGGETSILDDLVAIFPKWCLAKHVNAARALLNGASANPNVIVFCESHGWTRTGMAATMSKDMLELARAFKEQWEAHGGAIPKSFLASPKKLRNTCLAHHRRVP